MEENFEEAYSQAHYAYTMPVVPAETRSILYDPCVTNIPVSSRNVNFWVAMRALRQFVEAHDVLPLAGSIPDMTAATASYIALQQAYQSKAAADIDEVRRYAASIATEVGVSELSPDFVAQVCKNAASLRLKRFASLEKEYSAGWASQLVPLIDGSRSFDGAIDKNVVWCVRHLNLQCVESAHSQPTQVLHAAGHCVIQIETWAHRRLWIAHGTH